MNSTMTRGEPLSNRGAAVDFPAPFGPARTTTMGRFVSPSRILIWPLPVSPCVPSLIRLPAASDSLSASAGRRFDCWKSVCEMELADARGRKTRIGGARKCRGDRRDEMRTGLEGDGSEASGRGAESGERVFPVLWIWKENEMWGVVEVGAQGV